jgi:hypothetical protein
LRAAPIAIIALILGMIPVAQAQEETGIRPIFLVGCFDAQTYPPQYLPNYTTAIAELADTSMLEAYGDSADVLEVGDWFFLLEAVNMPNVVGVVLSMTVREGGSLNIPSDSVDRIVESFEAGLGMVAIHGPAYSPYFGRISREVFPVDGNKLGGGKISREGGIITVRHTHERRADHFITEGAPDSFDAADSFLIYRQEDGGSGFVPQKGSPVTLYVSQVGGVVVPSIIAYERESGRSVTFSGLKHTDGAGGYEKDRDWYNHSLALPQVRLLLGRSIVWAVEPLMEPSALESRLQHSADFFGGGLDDLTLEEDASSDDSTRLAQGSLGKMVVALAISVLLILAIAYLGFYRG